MSSRGSSGRNGKTSRSIGRMKQLSRSVTERNRKIHKGSSASRSSSESSRQAKK